MLFGMTVLYFVIKIPNESIANFIAIAWTIIWFSIPIIIRVIKTIKIGKTEKNNKLA